MCAVKVSGRLWEPSARVPGLGACLGILWEPGNPLGAWECNGSLVARWANCKGGRDMEIKELHNNCQSRCSRQVIKPQVYQEYRAMVQRELLVWSAIGSHPSILKLKDVLCSDSRLYFVSGENICPSVASCPSQVTDLWTQSRVNQVPRFSRFPPPHRSCAEMCTGGSLLGGLARAPSYSERDAAAIARKLLEALVHMHGLGLCHLDIKPENICLASR